MVQVVKRSLRKILSNSKLTYEDLLTVICKIKSGVYSRPLCYVYDDSFEEVMTRSHYLQTLIDHYWNRRRQVYLSELRKHHKLTNVIPERQIKLNKVLIIEEAHVPRSRWKIGQV